MIGARAAADSDPDGYTLLLGNTSTLIISPAVYQNLGYDPVRRSRRSLCSAFAGNMIVVNPALPAKSVRDLIGLAKRSPGKLNYASPGAEHDHRI